MPVEKNKQYIVDIVDNGFQGEGIAKIDDFTIFIPNSIVGEKVKIVIVKVLSSHAYGKIVEIISKSKNRVESDCATYKRCGGCNLRHINYETTIKMKQNAVQSLANKMLREKIKVDKTEGMEGPFHYRNKLQFPVGIDKNNKPVMGVFANRTHEIIPVENCKIQNERIQEIAKFIFDYIVENKISIYNEKTSKGLVRHIVIKIGINTNEVMCIVVINGNEFSNEKEFVKRLLEKFSDIKSVVKNINKKNTNVIMGTKNINLYGEGFIKDELNGLTFKISPLSFYQVNPIQTKKLYNLAIEKAKINSEDVVFDLYCGIGTISLFVSKYAKKVYGIEIVKEAIEMAKENAKINKIENVEFITGDVEYAFGKLLNKVEPDIIIVDPPRKGLDSNSIENILKVKPKKLIYISCNPATLMRDLAKIEDVYEIKGVTPVDLVPYTNHVECISVLELKQ